MTESATKESEDPLFHLFQKNGQALLFAPGQRLAFCLDAAGEVAARTMLREEGDVVLPSSGVSAKEAEDAGKELLALRERGAFSDRPGAFGAAQPAQLEIASVDLSYRCNLRCRYCFADHNGPRGLPLHMSEEVMTQTARFLACYYCDTTILRWIPTGGSSEVTLQLPMYEEFIRICESEGRRQGIALLPCAFISNLTVGGNGVSAEALKKWRWPLSVSLDGPPETHDAMRVYPDGRGTYSDVMAGVSWARSQGWNPGVDATITSLHPDVSEVYFHLFELGLDSILVKPVRARPDEPYAIGRNLEGICAGYDRFAERLLACPDEQLLRYLLSFAAPDTSDYFGRFLIRTAERHQLAHRCPAASEELVIGTDGRLYPCSSLTGLAEACMGSVWDGIDQDRIATWQEQSHLSRRLPCKSCWARFFCGGGCMYQSYLTHGAFWPPDPSECALNQHLIELAIWMMSELQHTRSNVLSALPRSAWREWQATLPVLCHRRASSAGGASKLQVPLQEWAPCDILPLGTGLKRRLPCASDRGELEVRLGWDSDNLHMFLTPRGAEPDAFWARMESVTLSLAVPRELADPALTRIPSRQQEFGWRLIVDPRVSQVRYDATPDTLGEGQPVPAGVVATGADGCFVCVPWASLDMRSPEAEAEFGLRVTLQDRDGGELTWQSDQQAVKVRLVR